MQPGLEVTLVSPVRHEGNACEGEQTLCVRKGKWRNEMFSTEVLHVQELKSCVSQKETQP